nr:immunoglobulin heavy chain junction region [Macaca mulatta]
CASVPQSFYGTTFAFDSW